MADHPTPHPELTAHLLGELEPGQDRRFLAHLEDCPECRAEAGELSSLPGLLAQMGPRVETPPGLRSRVLETVGPRARRRLVPALVAGGTALAVAAVALAVVLGSGDSGPAGKLELRAEAVAPRGRPARGEVEVRMVGIGRVISFATSDLPILPKGDFYELWFVGPGDSAAHRNRISAGTFHPDPAGRVDVTLTAAVDPRKFPVISVTAEPGNGNPLPTGPEVLRTRPATRP